MRVLITAGPTWVPIDTVRVISNTATGQTGILLAEKFQKAGVKVTLLLGPAEACCLSDKIRVIRFRFFDELKRLIARELKSLKYDAVIHSAAVSDYRPLKARKYKISSGLNNFQLKLVPTEKIIDSLKKISRQSLIVGFKFEPAVKKAALIREAAGLMKRAKLDLVVANSRWGKRYTAYIIGYNRISGPILTKQAMADKLINSIAGLKK